jgi:hypothetical protein
MPAGRPTDYKPEYCEAVINHMKDGASLTSFAAEINCARSTINVWMEQNAEFSEAVKIAKSKCAAWWEKLGRSGASGEAQVNPTLVIFGLKNMAADDWREKQEIDHTTNGKDMMPVVTVAFDESAED